MRQDAAALSCYRSQSGHRISSMRHISEAGDNACMRAVGRFLDRIDLRVVNELIDSLPESPLGAEVMPAPVREFHKQVLRRRVRDVLHPAYESWSRGTGNRAFPASIDARSVS